MYSALNVKLLIFCVVIFSSLTLLAGNSYANTCPNSSIIPNNQTNIKLAEKATACLINQERSKRGLRNMRFNSNLYSSSIWQAKDMDRLGYFDHNRPSNPLNFMNRITKFGYKGKYSTSVGENLVALDLESATPKRMVKLWMNSSGHKKNILRREWRDQGLALLVSNKQKGDYDDWGTYVIGVNQFGAKK